MQIDAKQTKWLPGLICAVLIVQVSVSFGVLPMLQPLSYLAMGLMLLSFVWMAWNYVVRQEATFFGLIVGFYLMAMVMITIISANYIRESIYETCSISAMLMLFNFYRHRTTELVKAAALIFLLIVVANIAFMVYFPTWLVEAKDQFHSYLLGGNYNSLGGRFTTGAAVCALAAGYGRWWKVIFVAVVAMGIGTLIAVGSMTSLSALIIFSVICLLPGIGLKKLAIGSLFTVFVLFEVFINFAGTGVANNDLLVWFIRDVLHKDLTFTHRTDLWDASVKLFFESPLVGYGKPTDEWMLSHIASHAMGPHNLILFIMVEGGLTLLITFIAAGVTAVRRFWEALDRTGIMLLAGTTTLLFQQVTEYFPLFFTFFLFTLLFYYPEIRAQREELLAKKEANKRKNDTARQEEQK